MVPVKRTATPLVWGASVPVGVHPVAAPRLMMSLTSLSRSSSGPISRLLTPLSKVKFKVARFTSARASNDAGVDLPGNVACREAVRKSFISARLHSAGASAGHSFVRRGVTSLTLTAPPRVRPLKVPVIDMVMSAVSPCGFDTTVPRMSVNTMPLPSSQSLGLTTAISQSRSPRYRPVKLSA